MNDVMSKAFPERRALSLNKKRLEYTSDIINDDYLP